MNRSNAKASSIEVLKRKATSTVGRGKVINLDTKLHFSEWSDEYVSLFLGDSLEYYKNWEQPTVIVSDGAYGVLGFEGDTSDHIDLPDWYQPHIEAWSNAAIPCTTLWFWNSEIGWAVVHPNSIKFPSNGESFEITLAKLTAELTVTGLDTSKTSNLCPAKLARY